MASPLPPDPYLALGVPKDASAAAIKVAYRKLVLKFHPDKVQDESQKDAAADQFHKIQTAYEIVGDEDKRARYEAQCKLAELRKDMMEKQSNVGGSRTGSRTDVRTTAYPRSTQSPGRTTSYSRGPERAEKVHVEERRPYEADYFDRPRSSPRKDYDYDRPKRSAPRDDRARPRMARQDTKENERARQREKTKQSTRDTRRDRDYKYAYAAEPESMTATESDSDSPTERARRQRREEDVSRKARSPYYDQVKRPREDPPQSVFPEDRTRKMSSAEFNARDYIERSRGGPRQYQESERRPSPSRMGSSSDKVEYIKRSEGRPAVMVRRGSGRPRTSSREAEESPRRSDRDRTRSRRASEDFDDVPRRPPPFVQTKSAPGNIKLPEPRRAYSLQADLENKDDFQPPPFRRADSLPQQPTRREDIRGPRKQSTLRQTEISEGLPTPGATPVDSTSKYSYGKEYADDHEYATPNGYRTEVREPATSRKVTRSPSPIKEERANKEEHARAASARYPASTTSPRPGPSPTTRTTSYMYTPAGVEAMPARPPISRNESSRKESLFGEVPTLSRPSMPRKESSRSTALYGEVPTTRSPRQTRGKWSPPPEEVRYAPKRDDVKYQTGYSSRRPSEATRPSYGRTSSYSQAAY